MADMFLKIGELAEKTGLSVRTLHYYDELGLLSPSYRTKTEHRLYAAEDIARLQQITSMKSLGFSLDEIKSALSKEEFSPEKVLGLHLDRIQTQLKLQQDLQERLEGMQRFLKSRGSLTAEEFLETIALMQKVEANFTEEEMELIRAQGEKYGKQKIIGVEEEWPKLMQKMKEQMEKGADPSSPEVQKLAKRWKELVEMFTGGNPAIAAKLKDMYKNNPDAAKLHMPGFDPAFFAYVERAMEVLEK